MNNYIGIGADAEACIDFHNLRDSKPYLFKTNFLNKVLYFLLGAKRVFNPTEEIQRISKEVTIYVDGKKISMPIETKCIIILSINHHAGVCKLPESENINFNDGLLEVVTYEGLQNFGLTSLPLIRRVKKILARGKEIKIVNNTDTPFQIDGEPTYFKAGTITVTFDHQLKMMKRI